MTLTAFLVGNALLALVLLTWNLYVLTSLRARSGEQGGAGETGSRWTAAVGLQWRFGAAAAALIAWAEVEEAKLATGEKLDVQTYTTAVNALRRLLGDLGLERVARDVTPPLADYLAAKAEGADP